MKIELLVIGKTKDKFLEEGIAYYLKKLKHYVNIELITLRPKSSRDPKVQKKLEEQAFLSKLKKDDFIVCLDEKGEELSSVKFSNFLQQRMNASTRRLVLVIGGAYGFNDGFKERSKLTLSLSKMTFTHDMARVILLEQIYRAMTILKNEPYHNN